jgi:hypothetical protein
MAIRINGDNTTAAPGITRGDDTDTGIQFGTDEVSIVTGGVERAKVDNVGRFDVNSGSSGVISAKQNTNNGGFNIYEGKDSTGSTKFYVTHNGRVGASEGVIFGTDTAAANILDDYEEGTWTPTITSGGWTGFQTISNAKYTKIGRQVTVYLWGDGLQGTGDGTALKVGGLPFTCATSGYAPGPVDFGESIDAGAYCRVASASTAVDFFRASGSVSTSRVAIAGNRIGNAYLIFSATYIVA